MNTVLTIAGSDCSGGAGIQADLKTMTALGVYGMSAITALTAQNTTGVYGIYDVTPEFLGKQLDCIYQDIRPDAVKIGMVSSGVLIEMIAEKLIEYGEKTIVLDPVMVSTSGGRLLRQEAVETLMKRLLPLAAILTPNIPEAEILAGIPITGPRDMERAAERIGEKCGCAVLVKGGHDLNDANDLFCQDKEMDWIRGRRIETKNTHGTGCTLSSAIASYLARGEEMRTAVKLAKDYVSGALAAGLDLGLGCGPMNHCFDLKTGTDGRDK